MKILNKGDRVITHSLSIDQKTQRSLDKLFGTIVNDEDAFNIHVLLDSPHKIIGFAAYELTKI